MEFDLTSLIVPMMFAGAGGLITWGALRARLTAVEKEAIDIVDALKDFDKRLDDLSEYFVSKELHRETLKQIKESISDIKGSVKTLMDMALHANNVD